MLDELREALERVGLTAFGALAGLVGARWAASKTVEGARIQSHAAVEAAHIQADAAMYTAMLARVSKLEEDIAACNQQHEATRELRESDNRRLTEQLAQMQRQLDDCTARHDQAEGDGR